MNQSLDYGKDLKFKDFLAHCRDNVLTAFLDANDDQVSLFMNRILGVEVGQSFSGRGPDESYEIENVSVITAGSDYMEYTMQLRPNYKVGPSIVDCFGFVTHEIEALQRLGDAASDPKLALAAEQETLSYLETNYHLVKDQVFRFPRGNYSKQEFILLNARPCVAQGRIRGLLAFQLDVLRFDRPELGVQSIKVCPTEPGYQLVV